jgi:SAM-dependent methyltransferase
MTLNAVEQGAGIYYTGTYWNDYQAVQDRIHERLSGDAEVGWMLHFQRTVQGRRFRHALILNCGNGHVERDLLRLGLIERSTGIDYAEDLLAEATDAARQGGFAAEYHRMDTNTAEFPDAPYDLVVNSAAGHHIARLDRVLRRLCDLLPEDGWLVSFDYVGPHRNQYPWEAWSEADRVNELLPLAVRQHLQYPHLPTMLATDPTEAIHSELILETMRRYFHVHELRPLGGAIAYPLLTHNAAFAAASASVQEAAMATILEADDAYLAAEPESSLFAYAAAQPDKSSLLDTSSLARWADEEDEREREAEAAGGHYYPLTLLQRLQLELEDLRLQVRGLRADLDRAHDQLERLPSPEQAAASPSPWRSRLDGLRGGPLLRLKQRSRVARGSARLVRLGIETARRAASSGRGAR